MKSEIFNHNSKPSYALMSTISGHETPMNASQMPASRYDLSTSQLVLLLETDCTSFHNLDT